MGNIIENFQNLDFSNDLIEIHKESEKLMPLIHLPVQSGSNKILEAMNRKHTVEEYLEILKKFSDWAVEKTTNNKDDASAGANDYLKTLGYVSIAYAWIKVLEVSFKDYDENKKFYNDKINTAKFYFDKILPRAEQHYKSAISGSSNIMNFKFN